MKIFLKRLPGLVDVYDVYKYNYATHVFDVNAVSLLMQDGTLDVTLSTIDNCPIYYTLDGSETNRSIGTYTEPLKLKKTVLSKLWQFVLQETVAL